MPQCPFKKADGGLRGCNLPSALLNVFRDQSRRHSQRLPPDNRNVHRPGASGAGTGRNRLTIHALERPANPIPNAINRAITAPVCLCSFPPLAPGQAIAAWRWATTLPDFATALGLLKRDLRERPAPLHVLRFRPGMPLRANAGRCRHDLRHFINRPAAVARYAAAMTGLPWACSAHAKDIFLQNENDLAAKLCRGAVDGDLFTARL